MAVERLETRTPTLPPATHTVSYALGERDVILVEPATPYPDERRKWIEWARGFESYGRRLVAIVLTHHHADHVGGAAFLSSELSLPIWAHAATAARLPELSIARHLEDGEELVLEGAQPERWKVLFTPGHAPGHVCLLEQALGALVVGDMVASEGTILIAPGDGDMREYLAQLARLAALEARTAYPAHGGPIEEPHRVFSHYIHHRMLREDKIVEALRELGPGSNAEALVPVAYADTPRAAWGLARLSVEAHLEKLLAEGRITAHRGGYRLTSSDPVKDLA